MTYGNEHLANNFCSETLVSIKEEITKIGLGYTGTGQLNNNNTLHSIIKLI
jgi:hypothetical protein